MLTICTVEVLIFVHFPEVRAYEVALHRCECQNMIMNVKIGFPTHSECQNRILNVKIGFSDSVRIGF